MSSDKDAWKELILFEEIEKWSHIWYHLCLQGPGDPYVACCVFVLSVWHKSVSYAWLTAVITSKPSFMAAPWFKPSDVHASHPPRLFTLVSTSDHLIPHPTASFCPHAEQDVDVMGILIGWLEIKRCKKITYSCSCKRPLKECTETFCSYFKCLFESVVFDSAAIFIT